LKDRKYCETSEARALNGKAGVKMAANDDILDLIRVKPGKKFRLKDHDPDWAGDKDRPKKERKALAKNMLSEDVSELAVAQDLLYASDTYAILLVFQAMDAAGKDSTIKHVMSGVNPQGCQVYSFKHPSVEELDHNFLWRYAKALPERGRIGIFNRSYYEEVLVVKVHPEILANQRVPGVKPNEECWQNRYEDINTFERHLTRNGTVILKFFLHISKEEQRKRFLKRLDDPNKHWKFSDADMKERGYWDDYMTAYEDCLNATSTEWAPWHVIPANHKWVSQAMVAQVVTQTIAKLDLKYPEVPPAKRDQIDAARRKLEEEG
jgi:PPK2 family polyphosphate:nucleotide phosphotransferase